MEREILERYLAEGLSLERIGEVVGRHPSTVGYWVRRHGLQAVNTGKHASRGGLDEDALRELVGRGLSTREIAAELGCSQGTVKYWLRRFDLVTEQAQTRRGAKELRGKYVERRCRAHGHVRFVLEGRGYYRCTRCRSEQVAVRRRRVKEVLVREAGGACVCCGYDRYIGALEFHHRDPSEKSFGLARGGLTLGIDRMRAEAAKCVLLCANCHAEVEGGLADATLVAHSVPGGAMAARRIVNP